MSEWKYKFVQTLGALAAIFAAWWGVYIYHAGKSPAEDNDEPDVTEQSSPAKMGLPDYGKSPAVDNDEPDVAEQSSPAKRTLSYSVKSLSPAASPITLLKLTNLINEAMSRVGFVSEGHNETVTHVVTISQSDSSQYVSTYNVNKYIVTCSVDVSIRAVESYDVSELFSARSEQIDSVEKNAYQRCSSSMIDLVDLRSIQSKLRSFIE